MESDTESSDSDEPKYQGSIDLTLDRLQSMMHVAGKYHHDESSYSMNGRSKTRIKHAINNPICTCKCRVNINVLMKICLLFWLLSKSGQDSVLWAIQSGQGKRNKWYIEGLVFCMIQHHACISTCAFKVIKKNIKTLSVTRRACLQRSLDVYACCWSQAAFSL